MAAGDREELASLAADLRGHLEWLRDTGVREVPALPKAPQAAASAAPVSSSPEASESAGPQVSLRAAVRATVGAPEQRAATTSSPAKPVAPPAPLPPPAAANVIVNRPAPAARAEPRPVAPLPAPSGARLEGAAPKTLEQIRAELGACTRCKLSSKRKNIVFGVGSPKAELVFVGEGPGADEDEQGIPFVGAAGQLLTKMIEAMGYTRDEVYICNVVKCRPPGNRNPEPDEIQACEPFLKQQLASLKPRVIVTLGKFAAQTLLRDETSITRLRGNWREYCGIRLMPTFHPAYLLRSPSEKKKVWEDLQQVMKVFGKEPARR
ncbi:MAG: uracil-DNA glycosylase [Deltaproteobacteria bacterium]|nr:uracil-DNA glycosylase [Deltaproteobacteria bacterium]